MQQLSSYTLDAQRELETALKAMKKTPRTLAKQPETPMNAHLVVHVFNNLLQHSRRDVWERKLACV